MKFVGEIPEDMKQTLKKTKLYDIFEKNKNINESGYNE